MREERVGFIGAGQMAEAIARGILAAGLFPPGALTASDIAEPRRKLFESLGIGTTENNCAVVPSSDVLIIAVKPQNLGELLRQIGPALPDDLLLITICAGCPTALFEAASSAPVRVVRAMPNLPARVRMGATALCRGRRATEADLEIAGAIFGAVGKVVVVEERLMDAVTALSGSGPAYFFFLVEAMVEAGRREGLSAPVARTLAVQTARGAAELMSVEDATPEELRRRVTSKGGTTEAALRLLEERKTREAFLDALHAAAVRAMELGRK